MYVGCMQDLCTISCPESMDSGLFLFYIPLRAGYPAACCNQSFTEQSEVGANTQRLCCGEVYFRKLRPIKQNLFSRIHCPMENFQKISNKKERFTMSTRNDAAAKPAKQRDVWKMTMTAMLSAIAFLLMFLEFSVPIMPSFIKMDLSELPALIGAFAMGPVSGAMICLIKNLLHLFMTTTGGVGELSNFILGAAFVVPAGLIYKKWTGKKSAILGALAGAVLMAAISIISNYFIVYPVYYNFMPKEAILSAYQLIFPKVENILQCLIVFNTPFTFVKGVFSVAITVLVYKPLSPFLKGNYRSQKAPRKRTKNSYQA